MKKSILLFTAIAFLSISVKAEKKGKQTTSSKPAETTQIATKAAPLPEAKPAPTTTTNANPEAMKFKKEVQKQFKKAGWFEGRNIENKLNQKIKNFNMGMS